ncbi:MAG: hypothetical protein ACREIA_12900 [Opitutaceae bacterium]
MTPTDDPLQPLVERLRSATPPQPQSVTREVWRRIAQNERTGSRARLLERIEMAFAQPAFGVAFVVACMLGGLFIAEVRASRRFAEQSAQIERHYLQLVDPLLDPQPAPLSATFVP